MELQYTTLLISGDGPHLLQTIRGCSMHGIFTSYHIFMVNVGTLQKSNIDTKHCNVLWELSFPRPIVLGILVFGTRTFPETNLIIIAPEK